MSLNITIPENINDTEPKISVIGIGGAGGNAVNTMINANVENIEFIVANTDGQALSRSLTKRQIQFLALSSATIDRQYACDSCKGSKRSQK